MKKILICDYPNALENDYSTTIQSATNAYYSYIANDNRTEDINFEIYAYENKEKLIEKLKDVSGLITGFLEIDESILSRADPLKCISVSGVGYSNIDMDAAKRHGVSICHIREYCTQEVAEHAFALIAALNRNLKYYSEKIENDHEWKYHTIAGSKNLSSQTIAIFGFGKIGKRVAKIAGAYGMEILAVDPYVAKNPQCVEEAAKYEISVVTAQEALDRADIITNHMNLTEENYHFFNEEAFSKMKKHPIFINVGRGGSVDEKALEHALDTKQIRAAGLDVLEDENPDLENCSLTGRENVIITPHSAFYSSESIEKLQIISGANMGYYLAGKYNNISEIVEK